MGAPLPLQAVQGILDAAKGAYGFPIDETELGQGLFPIKCCGKRLVHVSAFTRVDQRLPYSESNKRQVIGAGVCPVCFTTFIPNAIRPGMTA